MNLNCKEDLAKAAIDAGFSETWVELMLNEPRLMKEQVIKRMCSNAEGSPIDNLNAEMEEEPFDFFDQEWDPEI